MCDSIKPKYTDRSRGAAMLLLLFYNLQTNYKSCIYFIDLLPHDFRTLTPTVLVVEPMSLRSHKELAWLLVTWHSHQYSYSTGSVVVGAGRGYRHLVASSSCQVTWKSVLCTVFMPVMEYGYGWTDGRTHTARYMKILTRFHINNYTPWGAEWLSNNLQSNCTELWVLTLIAYVCCAWI